MDNDKLLKAAEVAEILRVPLLTIYAWVNRGVLPVIKISCRCIRFRDSDIRNFLNERLSTQSK